jgi:hypothetical protein
MKELEIQKEIAQFKGEAEGKRLALEEAKIKEVAKQQALMQADQEY